MTRDLQHLFEHEVREDVIAAASFDGKMFHFSKADD